MNEALKFIQSSQNKISDFFWAESFWLPDNYTWKQIEEVSKTTTFPKPQQILIAAALSVILLGVRLLWERFVAYPIGKYLNVRETSPRAPVPCELLEKAYRKKKAVPTLTDLEAYSKQLDWTTRQIERWWRRRRVMNKDSLMKRWKETSWRFVFYVIMFYYGLFFHLDKSWFYDARHCWLGWPYHDMSSTHFWYYMIELSFYFSSILSLTIDHRRKDFYEMLIHHFVTISLILLSFLANLARVGALILVCHDAVDYFMEGAKLAKYTKCEKLCNILFVIFAALWFITRIYLYPTRILYTVFFDASEIFSKPMFTSYYVYVVLLSALQVLHVMWFYMILRMVYRFMFQGEVEDERSDTDPDSAQEDDVIVANGVDGHIMKGKEAGEAENIRSRNNKNQSKLRAPAAGAKLKPAKI